MPGTGWPAAEAEVSIIAHVEADRVGIAADGRRRGSRDPVVRAGQLEELRRRPERDARGRRRYAAGAGARTR
ncbi:hypothetical protein [Streptomyces yanii]|uniref:Uncharacterized protein n=1 Tax=Streptomyces yanii TaxID=78510 RepID=A0ABV5RPA3_9ACTN